MTRLFGESNSLEVVQNKRDHKNNWYMQNPEPVLPSDRQPIQNWTRRIVDFVVSADHRVKKKSHQRDKYQELGRKLKKLWNIKVTMVPIVVGSLGTSPERLVKGLEYLEIRRQLEIIQTYSIINIGQNTVKTPGDLPYLRLQRETISYGWCEKVSKV